MSRSWNREWSLGPHNRKERNLINLNALLQSHPFILPSMNLMPTKPRFTTLSTPCPPRSTLRFLPSPVPTWPSSAAPQLSHFSLSITASASSLPAAVPLSAVIPTRSPAAAPAASPPPPAYMPVSPAPLSPATPPPPLAPLMPLFTPPQCRLATRSRSTSTAPSSSAARAATRSTIGTSTPPWWSLRLPRPLLALILRLPSPRLIRRISGRNGEWITGLGRQICASALWSAAALARSLTIPPILRWICRADCAGWTIWETRASWTRCCKRCFTRRRCGITFWAIGIIGFSVRKGTTVTETVVLLGREMAAIMGTRMRGYA